MSTIARHRTDIAHHHPTVRRVGARWVWECRCGGASRRTATERTSWHQVVIEALLHATAIAP
jgi:hypothetical protein